MIQIPRKPSPAGIARAQASGKRTSQTPTTAVSAGVRVADYTILGVVGKGGMGLVYLAHAAEATIAGRF